MPMLNEAEEREDREPGEVDERVDVECHIAELRARLEQVGW